MFGSKNKKNNKSSKSKLKSASNYFNGEDEYGPISTPPMSNDAAEKVLGGGAAVTRTDKYQRSIKISGAIIATSVAIASMTTMYFGVSNTMGNNKAITLAENAQSPAFKTRYADLGSATIQAYFRGDSPPMSMLSTVNWPTASDNAGSRSADSSSAFVTGNGIDYLAESRGEGFDFALPSSVLSDPEVASLFPNPREEVLSYYGMIDGTWYKIGLPVIIPDVTNIDTVPYLSGSPVFLEMDPITKVNADISRPDPETTTNGLTFTEVPLSDAAEKTISEWASAYAQKDRKSVV